MFIKMRFKFLVVFSLIFCFFEQSIYGNYDCLSERSNEIITELNNLCENRDIIENFEPTLEGETLSNFIKVARDASEKWQNWDVEMVPFYCSSAPKKLTPDNIPSLFEQIKSRFEHHHPSIPLSQEAKAGIEAITTLTTSFSSSGRLNENEKYKLSLIFEKLILPDHISMKC